MPKEKRETKKERKSLSFIWHGLRVSFWTMIGTYIVSIISTILNPTLSSSFNAAWVIMGLIQTLSIFFTFVVSIIHLRKYKQKVFAIIALVVSSLSILLFLLGILAGVLVGINGGAMPTA